MLACLAVSPAAWGEIQPMFGGELVEQDYAQIVFGDPGQLLIDGSDHKTILPLPMAARSFPTYEDYLEFLQSTFNIWTGDGGEGFGWSIVRAGSFYSYDASLQSLFQVSDPLLTLIGGRYGTISVGGVDYCIDGDRCPDPVHFFSLEPVEEVLENEDGQVLQQLDQASASAASSGSFSIQGYLRHTRLRKTSSVPAYGPLIGSTSTSITQQVTGGFQILRVIRVGGTIRCWSYLIGGEGCYFVPEQRIILESTGSNKLAAYVRGYAKQRRPSEACKVHYAFYESSGGTLRNVMSVSAEYTRFWDAIFLPTNHVERGRVNPTFLEGEHYGDNSAKSKPTQWQTVHTYLQVNPPEC